MSIFFTAYNILILLVGARLTADAIIKASLASNSIAEIAHLPCAILSIFLSKFLKPKLKATMINTGRRVSAVVTHLFARMGIGASNAAGAVSGSIAAIAIGFMISQTAFITWIPFFVWGGMEAEIATKIIEITLCVFPMIATGALATCTAAAAAYMTERSINII